MGVPSYANSFVKNTYIGQTSRNMRNCSVAILVHFWFLTMGSFGPEGGPPCELCRELPSVYHRDGEGLLCNRCLQSFENTRRAEGWSTIFRRHPVLREQIITFSVAEYLWGDGIDAYCRCGECSSSWFLKGWICWPTPLHT